MKISFRGAGPIAGIEAFRRFARSMTTFEDEEINEIAALVAAALREEAPGTLGERMDVVVGNGRAQYFFPAHAVFVQRGTPPHLILPVNAKALHFFGSGGDEVFAASVNHPGQKPNPFVTRAVEKVSPLIQQAYVARVGQKARGAL